MKAGRRLIIFRWRSTKTNCLGQELFMFSWAMDGISMLWLKISGWARRRRIKRSSSFFHSFLPFQRWPGLGGFIFCRISSHRIPISVWADLCRAKIRLFLNSNYLRLSSKFQIPCLCRSVFALHWYLAGFLRAAADDWRCIHQVGGAGGGGEEEQSDWPDTLLPS